MKYRYSEWLEMWIKNSSCMQCIDENRNTELKQLKVQAWYKDTYIK